MKPEFFSDNASILNEKGEIPYWKIASEIGCHVNTVRNWMKSKMTEERKKRILAAINEIKKELAKDQQR